MKTIMKGGALRFFLILCLSFICMDGLWGTVVSQASIAQKDTVRILTEKIRSLEERIEVLQSQLEDAKGKESSEEQAKFLSTLQSQLTSLTDEVEALKMTLDVQQERIAHVKIAGEERVRFLNIDTHGAQAVGAYGEELKQETTFKHYLRLETSVSVSNNLIAGGRLRLTNVSKDVLDEGPEYLSQEWGSAFLRYARKEFNCTIGVYDIHFTPFTLMRWDQEDNPEGGGEAGGGCLACGGVAAAIPSESLEELSPTLSFEGVRINGMVGEVADVVAFYARPQNAVQNDRFRRHLFGVRTKLLLYHPSSTSFRHVGITLLTSRDEKNSIHPMSAPTFPMENNIVGLDIHFPIFRNVLLRGEWVRTELIEDNVFGGADKKSAGDGFIGGVKVQCPSFLNWRISYLRLSEDYQSTFNAISYSGNRHGLRAASVLEIPQWKSSLSAFTKVLREISSTDEDVRDDVVRTFYTASIGITASPVENLIIRPSLIYNGTRRDEDSATADREEIRDNKLIFINEVILTVYKDNEFILRYQYVDSEDTLQPENDYRAETIFTLFSMKF